MGSGGEPTEVVVGDLKVKNRSQKMSREHSEEEDGVVRTKVLVSDETAETEAEFRPPRGTNRMPDDRPIITGAVGVEEGKRVPRQTNRFGSLDRAKRKRPGDELPIQQTPGPRRSPPGAGAQPVMPVNDRFMFERPKPTYQSPDGQSPSIGMRPITDRFVVMQSTPTPGHGSPLPKAGTRPVIDRFVEMPSMPTRGHGSPPLRAGTQPVTVLFVEMSTVPAPERGSPPPQAGIQPGGDRFAETSPEPGKQRVTAPMAEIPTLPAPRLDRPSWRTETPWGTGIRGSPVRAGPVLVHLWKGLNSGGG